MRIAFDTGGTFTDCVHVRDGSIEILKVSSTPRKPSEAIARALSQIPESGVDLASLELICGTT
ncbi:MAG TPA: hydantoinase/oxoprolinase N-terminal domain-containing protein, partial [Candidatus Sulfotelmatobacter sp.]|nr:hydantoinase/oxoprolinase N-terminal domain-containing protein [Candidatus Sulfotelmatobacter sp.]